MRGMITAELAPHSFVPVDLICWTAGGMVQVRRSRLVDGYRIFGVYTPVPVMKLIDSAGRGALARTLATLPRPETAR